MVSPAFLLLCPRLPQPSCWSAQAQSLVLFSTDIFGLVILLSFIALNATHVLITPKCLSLDWSSLPNYILIHPNAYQTPPIVEWTHRFIIDDTQLPILPSNLINRNVLHPSSCKSKNFRVILESFPLHSSFILSGNATYCTSKIDLDSDHFSPFFFSHPRQSQYPPAWITAIAS